MKNVFIGMAILMMMAAVSNAVVVPDVSVTATRWWTYLNEFSPQWLIENPPDDAVPPAYQNCFDETTGTHTVYYGQFALEIQIDNQPPAIPLDDPSDPAHLVFTMPNAGLGPLQSIKVWNWNYPNTSSYENCGIQTMKIVVIDYEGNETELLDTDPTSPTYNTTTFTLDDAPGLGFVDFGQVLDITDQTRVKAVRFELLTNFGNTHLAGMAEVRFYGDYDPSISIDAGPNRRVKISGSSAIVNLEGSATGITSTTWSQLSGPGTVVFADDSALDTAATFPAEGTYELLLADDAGYGYDTVTILILPETFNLDPIAYWPFDGDVLDAISTNDGIVHGNPQYVDGKMGQALQFDGDDDGVEITNESNFDGLAPATISFWFKIPDGARPNGMVLGKYHYSLADPNGIGWSFVSDSGDMLGDGGGNVVHVGDDGAGSTWVLRPNKWDKWDTINDGNWHHYAAVIYGGPSAYAMNLYIDGLYAGNQYFSASLNDEPVTIGYYSSYESGKHWAGVIDDVRIYDYDFWDSEVEDLFRASGGTRCSSEIAADLNSDCKVDMSDFALFAADWFNCSNFYPGDCFQ